MQTKCTSLQYSNESAVCYAENSLKFRQLGSHNTAKVAGNILLISNTFMRVNGDKNKPHIILKGRKKNIRNRKGEERK